MHRLFSPAWVDAYITAFFTGKVPGTDLDCISRMLHIHKENIYLPIQKHTDKILIIESSLEPRIADAVITREKGILIGVQVADCVPVLFHERNRDVIGAVHAGWRGTAAGILRKALEEVLIRYRGSVENLFVSMGPSIGRCCYQVDYDVFRAVSAATGDGNYHEKRGGKYLLDLPAANKCQAMLLGIPSQNIETLNLCTHCNPELFHSFRYAKGVTGRQGGFIGKLPPVT